MRVPLIVSYFLLYISLSYFIVVFYNVSTIESNYFFLALSMLMLFISITLILFYVRKTNRKYQYIIYLSVLAFMTSVSKVNMFTDYLILIPIILFVAIVIKKILGLKINDIDKYPDVEELKPK